MYLYLLAAVVELGWDETQGGVQIAFFDRAVGGLQEIADCAPSVVRFYRHENFTVENYFDDFRSPLAANAGSDVATFERQLSFPARSEAVTA